MMNLVNKPVALTSNTTKACDASGTAIYRAKSPIICVCVNELEFNCIYYQGRSFLYIQPCNKMQPMKMLATNANA